MEEVKIRPICPADNPKIARVIRDVLGALNVPKTGTALADDNLDALYEYYRMPGAAYYVVCRGDYLLGGGGIAPLAGGAPGVCELQKMYIAETLRGRGIGRQLLQKCLQQAGALGYSTCYLETMPYMKAAQSLYRQTGFDYLEGPLGSTGHTSCHIWMSKDLTNFQ